MNPFDAASPFDARYYFADADFFHKLHPFVAESVAGALPGPRRGRPGRGPRRTGSLHAPAAAEIVRACALVTPEEVYEEERRIQHNIRALVNCIRRQVSPAARPYVHLFATSADIMDTARALCLKEATRQVLLPDLQALMHKLIGLARQHADTPQMGRTHGQHAVPLTFGFAVALYVSRLGQRIEVIASGREQSARQIRRGRRRLQRPGPAARRRSRGRRSRA